MMDDLELDLLSEPYLSTRINDLPYDFTEDCQSPIIVMKCGIFETPEIVNNSLLIPHQHIRYVILKTVSFLQLQSLDISYNLITWLPDIFTLKVLKVSNCKLIELPSYLPHLEELECQNNLICEIPYYPNLIKLDCSANLIEHINDNQKMRILNISDNPVTSINIASLISLIAYDCPILVLHKNHLLCKRSSRIEDGKFKWISTMNAKIDYQKIIIDWNIPFIKVTPSINNKIYKFLFSLQQ